MRQTFFRRNGFARVCTGCGMVKIGKVLKAQGIKGEVKAVCYLDCAEMAKNVKQLTVGGSELTVKSFRSAGGFMYLQFEEIPTRNDAEALRGMDVLCPRQSISLPQDRYFVNDVLGCEVVLTDGRKVGRVKDVLQYGAADVYVCACPEGEVSFPLLKDLVKSVDVDVKKIVLSADRFDEVAVYED